jgi:enoyl-CoA hydratase
MLLSEQRDQILLLTLNRPEKRNALNPELIRQLEQTLTRTENNDTVSVVIITGAGPSFCAGLDLTHLLSLEAEDRVAYLQSAFALFQQLSNLPQPIIAAINGPAVAGGFDLAAFCDLRLCAPSATFAQPEVLLGLTQIMYPLYKVIGLGQAKELAFTGQTVSAADAYRIGLVNHIYREEELLEQSWRLGAVLASRPRHALFETKRLARELIELDTTSAMKLMFEAISERLRSEEHRREAATYVSRQVPRHL